MKNNENRIPEDGKMFGAITPGMIADQLKTQFDVALEKRKIHLEHPIRTLGEHEVELRLHANVTARLKLRVDSSTPVPPVEPAAEAKREKEEPKTEKRGRRPEASAEKTPKTEAADKPARAGKGERPARVEKPSKT